MIDREGEGGQRSELGRGGDREGGGGSKVRMGIFRGEGYAF